MPGFTPESVPVTWRLLTYRPTRLAVGALGVGLALMLILLLDGLWVGVQNRVALFEDHTGAQLAVVAPGTDSVFADASSLPSATVREVAGTPGVRWAAGVRTMYNILELHDGKTAVALVGADPGRPGGPRSFRQGRAPGADDEVAVDAMLADQHRLRVGGTLPVLGRTLRIVGLTQDTAMFMTPLVFVTQDSLADRLDAAGTTGTVLVGTDDPVGTAVRLRARGLSVRTTADLHEASLRLATRIYGSPAAPGSGGAVRVIELLPVRRATEGRSARSRRRPRC